MMVSLSLGEYDPMSIELDTCVELILLSVNRMQKHIHTFDDDEPTIQVLQGRWGPYIKMEKKNYKIPKDIDARFRPREMSYIIENQPKKKRQKQRLKLKLKRND